MTYEDHDTQESHRDISDGIRKDRKKTGPSWLRMMLILIGASIAASALCMGITFNMLESAVSGKESLNLLEITGISRLLKPIGKIELPEEFNLGGRITASEMSNLDDYSASIHDGRFNFENHAAMNHQNNCSPKSYWHRWNPEIRILGSYQYDRSITEEDKGMVSL